MDTENWPKYRFGFEKKPNVIAKAIRFKSLVDDNALCMQIESHGQKSPHVRDCHSRGLMQLQTATVYSQLCSKGQ